jgi:hypothetical protein
MLALTPGPSPVASRGEGKRVLPSPLGGRRVGDEGGLVKGGQRIRLRAVVLACVLPLHIGSVRLTSTAAQFVNAGLGIWRALKCNAA